MTLDSNLLRQNHELLDLLTEAEAERDALARDLSHQRIYVHQLRAAIVEHHRQKADDRCIEDDDRLYAAAGLPPCRLAAAAASEALANRAERFERMAYFEGWTAGYLAVQRFFTSSPGAEERGIEVRLRDWFASESAKRLAGKGKS